MKIDLDFPWASPDEVSAFILDLPRVDRSGMFNAVLEIPRQVLEALHAAQDHSEGDLPLERQHCHLVGLGGSAIAGELLLDMLPLRGAVMVHRGTPPPRDRGGVVLSSYSGNTREVIEIGTVATGGLRTVVVITSGGELAAMAKSWGVPVWLMPSGYQPRAAVGWSMGYLAVLLERWNVVSGLPHKLNEAAASISAELEGMGAARHPLVRAALPLARRLEGRCTVIVHTQRCRGAAFRLAAQMAENAKTPAFALEAPEALHNAVEGLGAGDPERWALVFMTDPEDQPTLRAVLSRAALFFGARGVTCLDFPSWGGNPAEITLNRLVLADLASVFLAALRGVDPTPISFINVLKEITFGSDAEPEEG